MQDSSAGAMTRKAFFVPISIGNRFYNRIRTRRIKETFLASADTSMVLLCDTLRYYAYRGRSDLTPSEAKEKTRKDTVELESMLLGLRLAEVPDCRVRRLSEIRNTRAFRLFYENFENMFAVCGDVEREVTGITRYYVQRFYKSATAETYLYQQKNVRLAAAISIYATEILKYTTELYVKEDGMLACHLYKYHRALLKQLLDKPILERKFVAIENFRDLPEVSCPSVAAG